MSCIVRWDLGPDHTSGDLLVFLFSAILAVVVVGGVMFVAGSLLHPLRRV